MKKYDYYRAAGRQTARRQTNRKKFSLSFLKPIFLLCLLLGICFGVYWAAKRAYEGWTASRLGTWKPKAVSVSGADGILTKEIQVFVQPKVAQPFAVSDAVALQQQLINKYPQLREVRVKRGLFSGNLNISLKRRVPIAKLQGSAHEAQFIDEDGTLYAEPNADPMRTLAAVKIEGEMPAKLEKSWISFIQQSAKNKLAADTFVFHIDSKYVDAYLTDGTIIHFGTVNPLREKLRRASQIVAHQARVHPSEKSKPYSLDFTYFENGKVFLRQNAR